MFRSEEAQWHQVCWVDATQLCCVPLPGSLKEPLQGNRKNIDTEARTGFESQLRLLLNMGSWASPLTNPNLVPKMAALGGGLFVFSNPLSYKTHYTLFDFKYTYKMCYWWCSFLCLKSGVQKHPGLLPRRLCVQSVLWLMTAAVSCRACYKIHKRPRYQGFRSR